MSAKKKPTMKEMEKVVNNIIHDLQIINKKADEAFWGLKNYVEFSGKEEEFNKFLEDIKKKAEKEENERVESNKAITKTDSDGSIKK